MAKQKKKALRQMLESKGINPSDYKPISTDPEAVKELVRNMHSTQPVSDKKSGHARTCRGGVILPGNPFRSVKIK